MKATDHSKALFELWKEGMSHDELLRRLDALLARTKRSALKPRILADLLALIERYGYAETPTLTIAREEDAKRLKNEIEASMHALGATTKPRVKIDETLTGGHILEHAYERIDKSYKRTLHTLYKHITRTTDV